MENQNIKVESFDEDINDTEHRVSPDSTLEMQMAQRYIQPRLLINVMDDSNGSHQAPTANLVQEEDRRFSISNEMFLASPWPEPRYSRISTGGQYMASPLLCPRVLSPQSERSVPQTMSIGESPRIDDSRRFGSSPPGAATFMRNMLNYELESDAQTNVRFDSLSQSMHPLRKWSTPKAVDLKAKTQQADDEAAVTTIMQPPQHEGQKSDKNNDIKIVVYPPA
jgi:hypothetical protein